MQDTPSVNAVLVPGSFDDVVAAGDIDAGELFLAEDVVDRNPVFGAGAGRESLMALAPTGASCEVARASTDRTDDRHP